LFEIQIGGIFWALLLGLAGLVFISVYIQNRSQWWGLIPGFVLLGIAATILVDAYLPRLSGVLGGFLVLGGIGTAFVFVFLADRRNWWAVIPAGVMLTLALITVIDQFSGGFESGGILFLGMALTFVVVALLPTPHGRMNWAWYPAAALGVIGLLISAAAENLMSYFLPAALILGGILLIYRTMIVKKE
jgi:hypothetical protein